MGHTPPLLYLSITLLLCLGQATADYSLRNVNVLNLLMPYSNEVQMNYIVQAFNGCYKWTSKFPETLKIESLDERAKQQYLSGSDLEDSIKAKCENAVMVSVGERNDFDGIVWLTASDVETQEILKCEAKVKKIRRLQILTKFRTLDVGDHEQVELIAFDDENNSFTTLEGLKFEWSVKGQGRAKFVNFRDSNFKSTEERHRLEQMNYQTDIVILKGLRTGKVTLTVKLMDKSYKQVIQHSVDIFIIEHFEIEPQRDVFLLPCTTKQLELYTVRTVNYKMQRTRVSLPSSDFLWSTGDSSKVTLGKNGMLTTFKVLGRTKYVVKDRAKEDNKIERNVSVVVPRNINLYVKEISEQEAEMSIETEDEDLGSYENNWNLLKGRYYRVLAGLFDERDNRINLGEKETISFKFETQEFETIKREKDHIILKPIITMKRPKSFSAVLNFHNQSCLPQVYKANKQYSILSELKLVKASLGPVSLPTNNQKMHVFAMGGSGNYQWSSSNEQILQMQQNGIIVTKGAGMAYVIVRDRNNLKNEAKMMVGVIDPASYRLVERKIEMLRGGSRQLMYSAVDSQGNSFTYCDSIRFSFDSQQKRGLEILAKEFSTDSVEEAIEQNRQIRKYLNASDSELKRKFNEDYEAIFGFKKYKEYVDNGEISKDDLKQMFAYYQNYGVCSGFEFSSETPGEYELKHAFFKKKGIVRVYESYAFQYPNGYDKHLFSERPIILYGSTGEFTFKEGPWLWKDNSKAEKLEYQINYINQEHRNLLKIKIIEEDGDTKVFVKCLIPQSKPKNTEIDVEIIGWNQPDEELRNPTQVRGLLRVACKLPSAIRMYKLKANDSQYGYLKRQRKKLGLDSGKEYSFVAELFDKHEHLFWRKQSGLFEWVMDNQKLGEFVDEDKKIDRNMLRLFKEKIGTGWAKVRMTGLKKKISENGSIKETQKLPKNLEDKLQIEGLDKVTLSSEDILIYYHPDMRYELKVENGSGDFKVTVDDQYLNYRFDYKGKKIIIEPKKLGSTTIEVEDLGSEATMKAVANIDIVEIRRIDAEVEHAVLEEGKETNVNVQVYAENDRLIPKNQYHLMDLQLGVLGEKSRHVDIKEAEDPIDNELFVMRPRKANKYQLEVTGRDFGGYPQKSEKIEIDVFESMKVFPDMLILAPGCVSSFEIRGGPNKTIRNNADFDIVVEYKGDRGELTNRGNGLFEYKAKSEGAETATLKLINKKNKKIISDVQLKIAVVIPDGLDVIGLKNNKLLKSALARVIAVPTYKNRQFTPALCPISFEWVNLHPSILQIEEADAESCGDLPNSEENDGLEGEASKEFVDGWKATAKNVKGLSAGFASVEVMAEGYKRKFKKNINLEVINGIGAVRDKYIKVVGCEEGLILLPPSTSYQVRLQNIPLNSNVDYDFSILQSQHQRLLRTNSSGYLKTSSKEGYVLLKISEKQNPENELLIPVVIKKPASLVIEDSGKVALVPEDSSMSLKARLIDSLGRVYAHPLKDFKLSALSSDSNILHAHYNENRGEVKISSKRQGQATVLISHPEYSDHLVDVLPIRVGSLISPASPVNVHIGGQVNYKINNQVLLNKSQWRSSDSDVVRIEDGKVKAFSQGKAELRFDNTVKLSSMIEVFSIDQIVEEDTQSKTVTNISGHGDFKPNYHFMLKLLSNGKEVNLLQSEQERPEIVNNLTWGCSCSSPSFTVKRQKFINPQNSLPYMGCLLTFADFQIDADWDFSPQASIVFFLENREISFRLEHRISLQVIHGFFFSDKSVLSDPIQMDNNSRSKEVHIRTRSLPEVVTEPMQLARNVRFIFDKQSALLTLKIDLPEDFSEQRMVGTVTLTSQSGQSSRIVVIYDPSSTIIRKLANIANFSPFFWTRLSFSDFVLILVGVVALGAVFVYLKWMGPSDSPGPFRRGNAYGMNQRYAYANNMHYRQRNYQRGFARIS